LPRAPGGDESIAMTNLIEGESDNLARKGHETPVMFLEFTSRPSSVWFSWAIFPLLRDQRARGIDRFHFL
jgi:hypothetical protein